MKHNTNPTLLIAALAAVAVVFVTNAASLPSTTTEETSTLEQEIANLTFINDEQSVSYLPNPICDWWSYRFEAAECGFLEAAPPVFQYSYCKYLHNNMNFKILGTKMCYKRSCNGYGDDIGQCYPTDSCRQADARGLCNKGTVCCTKKIIDSRFPRRRSPPRRQPRRQPQRRRSPSRRRSSPGRDLPDGWPRLPSFPRGNFPTDNFPDRGIPNFPGGNFPFPSDNFPNYPRDSPGGTLPQRRTGGSSESNES